MVSESGERYQQSDELCLATGVGFLKDLRETGPRCAVSNFQLFGSAPQFLAVGQQAGKSSFGLG
jgi:hypothetical protein